MMGPPRKIHSDPWLCWAPYIKGGDKEPSSTRKLQYGNGYANLVYLLKYILIMESAKHRINSVKRQRSTQLTLTDLRVEKLPSEIEELYDVLKVIKICHCRLVGELEVYCFSLKASCAFVALMIFYQCLYFNKPF